MNISEYIEQISSQRKQIFFNEALKLGIKIDIISEEHKITKFSFEKKSFFMLNDNISFNTKTTAQITRNKEITKLILASNNICVPKGVEANDEQTVKNALETDLIKYPLVVKPIDAAKGVGISVDIKNEKELEKAINLIKEIKKDVSLMVSDNFIAEEMFYGNDYRVLVLNNEILGCVNRIPAHIIGNGQNTIKELIEKFNETRPKNYSLIIDNDLTSNLEENSLTLESVIEKNKKVFLRKNANISSGGVAVDYTDTISERFKKISLDATRAINGVFVGIDLFTDDITSESENVPYTIIEINGAPDYDIHESPVLPDSSANISKKLLEFLLDKTF